jgi:hypothetical protein
MLYTLSFRVTEDGYLRIVGLPSSLGVRADPVVAIQYGCEVFEAAMKQARISPWDAASILSYAKKAYAHPGSDVCCDKINLTAEQLSFLCLTPKRSEGEH